MKKLGVTLLAASLFAIGFTSPASAGTAGSIKLKKAQVKNVGPAICGQVNGTWVPGYVKKTTKTTKYFTPHTTQASIYTSQANKVKIKGSAKKKAAATKKKNSLLKQATQYSNMHAQFAESCSSGVYQMPLGPGQTYCEKRPLQINLSGAAGVAITGSSNGGMSGPRNCVPRMFSPYRSFVDQVSGELRYATSDESNLFAVTANGAMRQAFSAMVSVRYVLVSPTNEMYIVFNNRTPIDDLNSTNWGKGCVLAKANRADNSLTCVDDTLDNITWSGGWYTSENAAIQFLPDGSMYYSGYSWSGGTSNHILRKYQNGQATTIVSAQGQYQIQEFAVLSTGDVAVRGYTMANSTNWFRIYWVANNETGYSQIAPNSYSSFMRVLSDGNLYYTVDGWSGDYASKSGLYQLKVTGPKTVSKTRFLSNVSPGSDPSLTLNTNAKCAAENISDGPCNNGGYIYNTKYIGLINGNDYLVSGKVVYKLTLPDATHSANFELLPNTLLDEVLKVTRAGENIVLLGKYGGFQRLVKINTASNAETRLLPVSGSDEDFDLFHMAYRATDSQLFANIVRSLDAKTYIAQIDLNTGAIAYRESMTEKLEDLQIFTD